MDSAAEPVVDLTNCDREPIHIPGAILPHGAMLVMDCDTLVIEQVAGDTARLVGRAAEDLLGACATTLWTADQIAWLHRVCNESDLNKPRHLLDPALRVQTGQPIDASLHRSDGRLVVELEAADLEDPNSRDPLACVQQMLEGLDEAADLQAFCQSAAERVRQFAAYDRVMVYRFAEDGSGWVFAEAKRDDLNPFLDLHYPASDIPKQARALYLRNWLRLICQVDYDPAPLVPQDNPATGRPLDMSHALLRDVSPIHREYLRNMGVDASMSISIIRGGQLWGLFSCHHYSPRWLPQHLRAICELFGSMFSLQLEARDRMARFESRSESRGVLQTLIQSLAGETDYAEGLTRNAPSLLDYLDAGGLALRLDGGSAAGAGDQGISTIGTTPSNAQVAALTEWLCEHMDANEGVFTTDRLGDVYPPAREFPGVASGLLAIAVSREPSDFILWFRPELIQTVKWGGDPTKPAELGPNGARLTPRKSFELWSETVRGRSIAWQDADRDAAFDLRVALLDVVLRRIDAAARERDLAFAKQQLLMAELDHRVKNTLATIQALVTQTSNSGGTLEGFATTLNRRIQSMSRVHSLLTKNQWEGVNLQNLLVQELEQYDETSGRLRLSGPAITLSSKASLAVSLAIHELATNAAKYGSLSLATGSVTVSWTQESSGELRLEWSEHGGPPVASPTKKGFGTTLIERALALETGGKAKLMFQPAGLRCEILLPADTVEAAREVAPVETAVPEMPLPKPSGARRILVVEDSSLVILMVEDMLEALGWELVGPATRVDEAMALVRSEQIDAALVDINLDGVMSWDVAATLQQRGIPFALTTGYDGATVLPDNLRSATVISKPFSAQAIARWLSQSLTGA